MKPHYQEDREWLLILLLLLLGGICLQGVARAATRLPSLWTASTNMYSKLNPDESYEAQWRMIVEPLRPEIMTPPVWSTGTYLTPEKRGKGPVVSPASLGPTRTPEPTETPKPPEVAQPTRVPEPTQEIKPTETPKPTLEVKPTETPKPTLEFKPTTTPMPTDKPKPTKEPRPTKEPKEPKPPKKP